MTLGDLIERLEQEDQNKVLKLGFDSPHSYRGYYNELAFEPVENVTVSVMLDAARSCVERTFSGYKGGYYTMTLLTDCWLANYGSCGDELTLRLLNYMLNDRVALKECGNER